MHRRSFLALSAGATLLPVLGHAAPLDYEPGLLNERLNAGETVFLDFKASWCPTCQAQGRVIEALKAENPAYEASITFIDVDWDKWGNSSLRTSLNVPRRSTLIALKGEQELGRLVAQTARAQIKALMDTALAAAIA